MKPNNNMKALKSGVWYTLSSFLVKCMGFITTPIFARLLTKGEYGEFSNFLSWMNIAITLVGLHIESSLISARYEYEDRFKQYALSILTLSAISTGAWLIVGNLFSEQLSAFLEMSVLHINLLLVYCLFITIVHVFQACERYQYQYKKSVFVSLLMAFSTTVLSVILVLTMDDGLTGRILGHTVPVFFIGAVLLGIMFRNGKKIDPSFWKFALKISVPYIPHQLSLSVLHASNKVMITKMFGAATNALYSVAYTVGHMAVFLMTSLNMAFSPWLAEKVAEDDRASIRKVTRFYILGFVFIALGIMLLAPEILLIMGGKQYLEAKYVMPPIALCCVLQFLCTLFVNLEQIKKKTLGMAFASAGAAVVNVVLNYILMPRFGYVASGYSICISYVLLLLVHIGLVRKLGCGDMYDVKMMFATIAGMLVIMMGINVLYSITWLRYAIILVYGAVFLAVAWKFRHLIFMVLRKDKKKKNAENA